MPRAKGRVAVDTVLEMVGGGTVPRHVDVPFELVTPDDDESCVDR